MTERPSDLLVRDPATGRLVTVLPDGRRKTKPVYKLKPLPEAIPPAPYFVEVKDGHTLLVSADGRTLARLWGFKHEQQALASLLARAPMLEEALRAIDPSNAALAGSAGPRPRAQRRLGPRVREARIISAILRYVVPHWMTKEEAVTEIRRRLRAVDDIFGGVVELRRSGVPVRRGLFFAEGVKGAGSTDDEGRKEKKKGAKADCAS